MLDINPGLIVWTVITFLILLVILRAVAWKPMLSALDEREKRIQDALELAERTRREVEQQGEENRRVVEQAQAEARRLVMEGRHSAEHIAQQIQERAETQAAHILEEARKAIQAERAQTVQELHTYVADIAIQAARKVLDDQIDDARARRIVDDVISRMPESAN
jgi:F-type H+-transporting ATPase subunit b